MPCDPEPSRVDGRVRSGTRAPRLVTDESSTVGFLDAPDASAGRLVTATLAAFERLADGATLTVFSRSDGTDLAELCRDHAIEVIACFVQPSGGTTWTLVRR